MQSRHADPLLKPGAQICMVTKFNRNLTRDEPGNCKILSACALAAFQQYRGNYGVRIQSLGTLQPFTVAERRVHPVMRAFLSFATGLATEVSVTFR
jgi:hypothetical protein